MRNPTPIFRIIPALVALCIGLAPAALGQGAVGVQPNAVILEVAPGGSVTQELRIDNPGSNPLGLTIYPGDWQLDGSDQINYYPAETLERSAAGWLTLSATDLSLASRANTTLTYTVQVPDSATAGTYWAAVFIEGVDPATEGSQALAAFRLRTAHTFYINVPPIQHAGSILGIFGTPPQTPEQPYRMQLSYMNEGNTVQILNGQIDIRTVTGELVDTVPVEREVALPGLVKSLNIALYGPLPASEYLALAVLNYGDFTRDVAAELVFEVPIDLAAPEFYFEGARERASTLDGTP